MSRVIPKRIETQQARRELAEARKKLAELRRLAFDGSDVNSRPTPAQDSVLRDIVTRIFWLVCGNRSGKSQLGSRVVSWWFNNEHLHMQRPKEWGTGPLQILVVGRVGEQMTSELYERKIKPFLQPGTYKEVKIGSELRRIEHRQNGNRIIFLSHHDATNAREKVQSFTAHVVWLDEMPDDAGLVTELMMRTLTTNGRMYATFTPLIRNEEIKRIVETAVSSARKVMLLTLDNPVFKGREAEVEADIRAMCSSEDEYQARMYGKWYHGDTRVFHYSEARSRRMPDGYSPFEWRHVAVLDPAASGYAGLIVAGEDPMTGHWYIVKAAYIKGDAAVNLLATVESEISGFAITDRWCDCNPAGFYKESNRQRKGWKPYTEKKDRKLDLIETVNKWLAGGRLFVTPAAYRLENEWTLCAWKDKSSAEIIAASKYHLADCVRYLVDVLPAWNAEQRQATTPTQQLRQAWKAKQERKAAVRTMQVVSRRGHFGRASTTGRWSYHPRSVA